MLKVEPIQNGVVIEHITAGRGMEIYRLLQLGNKHRPVALRQSVHPNPPKMLKNVVKCTNPRCITSIEAGCEHIFRLSPSGKYRCVYCNQEI